MVFSDSHKLVLVCLLLLGLAFLLALPGLALPSLPANSNLKSSNQNSEKPSLNLMADKGSGVELIDLRKDQILDGFRAVAIYLNDASKPLGARFKHERSGFTVDLLQIESAPQAFIWVNTILDTDSGVAHTQEHLLLGKGNKGRSHGSKTQMMLVNESAGTDQWRTYYHFSTSAGTEVFYKLLDEYLDMLLHPDYTDEEIRREVRNFQVRNDSKDNKLKLEEGGTVYNEMMSSSYKPANILWFAVMDLVYGKNHPLAHINGGSPEGIRKLVPSEIRKFHKKNYVLDNMGMIVSLPKEIPVGQALGKLNSILGTMQKTQKPSSSKTSSSCDSPTFPEPKPEKEGGFHFANFPESNNKKPGTVEFVWPARLKLNTKDQLILQYFLTALAGDADTPLYKKFVDSKTVSVESGATAVAAFNSEEQGLPVMIAIYDVDQTHMNENDILKYRTIVGEEINKIANYKDGSSELETFNKRVLGRLAQDRRYYSDFVNKPPSFGSRGNTGTLMKQFMKLERKGGFERYLTLKPELDAIEKELQPTTNIWRDCIKKWGLLETVPLAIGTRPDPALLKSQEQETQARIDAETDRLKKLYKVTDTQEVLSKYKEDYDKTTQKLEELSKEMTEMKLVDSPPLTKDPLLDFEVSTLPGNIPLVTSTFQSMSSCNTSIAFRLDGVAEKDLFYLSILPDLLSAVGVIENGKAVPYEEMLERMRNEVYYVNSWLGSNDYTGRYELRFNSAGCSAAEAKRAIYWLELFMHHPYLEPENLPRIRDLIEQKLSAFRATRDAAYEETWDYGVASAYAFQRVPLALNTGCFLTMMHNVQRLKWQLRGSADPADLKLFADFMKMLGDSGSTFTRDDLQSVFAELQKKTPFNIGAKAGAEQTRNAGAEQARNAGAEQARNVGAEQATNAGAESAAKTEATAPFELTDAKKNELLNSIKKQFEWLPKSARNLVGDAAADLVQDLPDCPDDSLQSDLKSLCNEIAADAQISPVDTLKKLNEIRESIFKKGAARTSVVGSRESQKAIAPELNKLISGLSDTPFHVVTYSNAPLIINRLKERTKLDHDPIFVALVNLNTHQGIVMNGVPSKKYTDIDDNSLLEGLAINLLGGAGGHGLFMKTWGAGLAYGNGPVFTPGQEIAYYADKMPSMPETLKFVAEQISKAKPDPKLVDYAIVQCVKSRAAAGFEERASAMADDLADGITPEIVRSFRQAILKLRERPRVYEEMFAKLVPQYSKIVPGLGTKLSDVPNGKYIAIGDEKQLSLYEDYLKTTEGSDTKLYRIWARDFWYQ